MNRRFYKYTLPYYSNNYRDFRDILLSQREYKEDETAFIVQPNIV
jgi:hypothetical protein